MALTPLRKWLENLLGDRTEHGEVVEGRSTIHAQGLFARRAFQAGQVIGALGLGPACAQGRHTLQVGLEHRTVQKPWRFLNHSCRPSAALRFTADSVVLVATRDVAAASELTINYNLLSERVGSPFQCRCPSCATSSDPMRVTGEVA